MKLEENGKMPYNGVADCFIKVFFKLKYIKNYLKTVKREGFFKLWIGVDAFFFRAGIHIFLVIFLLNKSKNFRLHYY